jgi:hypothetical protein
MSERWALRMARRSVAALGELRRTSGVQVCEQTDLVPGVEGCAQTDLVWLRGESAEDEFTRRLLAMPESQLFVVIGLDEIVPHGARVPVGRLPEGTWQPLSRWLVVTLEPAALPARGGERVRLRMMPSNSEREANVLLTSFECFAEYAVNAPLVRLQRWRFAVSGEGVAVILGTPLPPLPGQLYCETEGVAVQAGWTWTPRVEATVVRQVLDLTVGDVALLHANGSWERIGGSHFTAATRSAIRRTGGTSDEP